MSNTAQHVTGHIDTFCESMLPPRELWPVLDFSQIPELNYPNRLNCANELLDAAISKGDGNRTVFIYEDEKWTYNDLFERANQIAHVLVDDLGVVPGNRVLLRAPNTPMLAACWFAVMKVGAVAVCTMPLLRQRELTYAADRAEIKVALCDSRIIDDCIAAMLRTAEGKVREQSRVLRFHGGINKAGSSSHNTDGGQQDSLEELMRDKPKTFTNCDTAAEDICLIAFTSGTTGKAKGTMHAHRDVMAITDCFPKYVLKPTKEDVFCGSPPFAFTYALGGILLFPIRVGASTLLIEQPSPPNLIAAIHKYRPTVCFTAPTAYRAMLPLIKDFDISSLRRCVSAGETLPLATYQAWQDATGIKIIDGIGATEMLHIFISASDDDIRPGATGKVVPGYKAKVIDKDGNDVPVGEIGRLAVQGPTGCRYMDDIDRQKKYVRNGWNMTGDSYRMDAEGYFWYQARTDDMIISSGHNISGPEVENVLLDHPAVQECAVIGTPCEDRGSVVTAYIVLTQSVADNPPTVKELQDYVKSEIAPYKYPRRIEFVNALPRTETGKLQRFKLRELHSD